MTTYSASFVWNEFRKLPAFLRRDLLVMLSYRLAFVSDWVNLLVQVALFSFVGRLINPGALPQIGGNPTNYLEYVTVGIAIGGLMQVGLAQLVAVVCREQLMGTLESLLLTPTALLTVQLGSVVYDLIYVPVRTALFLVLVSLVFGVGLDIDGLWLVTAVLLVFIPFVWGLGLASAGGVLTFRRGGSATTFGASILTLLSGAYFPLDLLPEWLQEAVRYNPVTVALDASREALLGGAGWAATWPELVTLLPMALASLGVGTAVFHWALRRELRQGTLNLY